MIAAGRGRRRQRRGGAPAAGRHRGGHERLGRAAGQPGPCSTPASASSGRSAALAWLALLAAHRDPRRRPCRRSARPRWAPPESRSPAPVRGSPPSPCRCSGSRCLPGLSGHAACRSRSPCCCRRTCCTSLAAGAWIGGLAVLLDRAPGRHAPAGARGPHAGARRHACAASPRSPSSRSPRCWPAGSSSRCSSCRRSATWSTRRTAARSSSRARSSPCCSAAARSTAAARSPRCPPPRRPARRPGGPGSRCGASLRAELALGVAALAVTGALAGLLPGRRAARPGRSRRAPTSARRAPSSRSSRRAPAPTRSTCTSSTARDGRQ